MDWLVRLAEPGRDNAALCALARRCPQGQRLRFYHEREDFWERCRLQPDATVLVAELQGAVVGSVTVARKALWLRGDWRPTAYLCDLLVDPSVRGRGVGRSLVRAARDLCPQVQLLYCCVVSDNVPSRRLFEGEGFRPHPHRLLYHVLLPPQARRRPGAWLTRLHSSSYLDTVLRSRYELLDSVSGQDGLFLVQHRDAVAWAALRRHDPQVFVELPWYADLVGRLLPGMPRRGQRLRIWSLHHCRAEGSQPGAALRRLLGGLAWLAVRAGVDAVAMPLFDNDPCAVHLIPATLTGWGVPPGAACFYLAGDLTPQVLAAQRPLLLSPRDA